MGLGKADAGRLAESLATARQKAQDARAKLADGHDPLRAKREQAARKSAFDKKRTFADCAAAYVAAHLSSWRSPIHARQWDQTLSDYVLPVIGKLAAADVQPADVKRVLAPLWNAKPEVARKVCGKVGMVLRFAIADGAREAANPASLMVMRTVLGPLRQKPKHHAAVPYATVPKLVEGTTATFHCRHIVCWLPNNHQPGLPLGLHLSLIPNRSAMRTAISARRRSISLSRSLRAARASACI
jgi:hypothetical protein